jgi:hypothetical protein
MGPVYIDVRTKSSTQSGRDAVSKEQARAAVGVVFVPCGRP